MQTEVNNHGTGFSQALGTEPDTQNTSHHIKYHH